MLHRHTHSTERFRTLFVQLQDAFLARRGVAAYIPITFVVIILFCAASWEVFWPTTDPARYQCYALTFWLGSNGAQLLPAQQCAFLHLSPGQPPFHLLPLEYPPLTLIPFSLALLAPISYYQLVFALLMALTAVLIHWVLLRYGPRGAGLIFSLYLLGGAVATAHVRFDLLPAALTLIALAAAERKHWTSAYIALAFGTLLKLYPILLLPALFIAEQQAGGWLHTPPESLFFNKVLQHVWDTLRGVPQWRWRNCAIFFAIFLSVTGAFALLNFQGAIINQLSYFAQRPVQVESTGSTLLWSSTLFGIPLKILYSFGSLNIISPLDGVVSLITSALFMLGLVYMMWMQWRRKMDVAQASIALLLVFIATGKVFSPQYIIWLIPLLAYVGAFDAFWFLVWGPAAVLTTIIFAYFYTRPVDGSQIPFVPGFFQVVASRNFFFILITLAYLFNWFQARERRSLPPLANEKETKPLSQETRSKELVSSQL